MWITDSLLKNNSTTFLPLVLGRIFANILHQVFNWFKPIFKTPLPLCEIIKRNNFSVLSFTVMEVVKPSLHHHCETLSSSLHLHFYFPSPLPWANCVCVCYIMEILTSDVYKGRSWICICNELCTLISSKLHIEKKTGTEPGWHCCAVCCYRWGNARRGYKYLTWLRADNA